MSSNIISDINEFNALYDFIFFEEWMRASMCCMCSEYVYVVSNGIPNYRISINHAKCNCVLIAIVYDIQ